MSKIHVLDKALAELIAAGEVVERPASIAKELIENAIDAGASSVTVEIEGGGITLLRVKDNGCGIPREDIPTAFLRHATSKIKSESDLESILTLGFRGEALASIAAMCRVELLSKAAGEDEGSLCRIEGGEIMDISPAGCSTGSIITVRDVFYNTPARMKFLKKDVGEANAIALVVDKCALSHPEIAFRFVRDGKVRLQSSGSGDLRAVIAAVYDREYAGAMLPVRYEMPEEGIAVSGYVTAPSAAKPSRVYQNFFLNARYVRTKTAAAALEEACKTFVCSGKYPGCVLCIDIAPGLVDVNVHPAKTQVRFVNEKPVFHCVYFAVKNAISPNGAHIRPQSAQAYAQRPPNGYAARQNPSARMTAEEYRTLFARENDVGSLFRKPLSLNASALSTYAKPANFPAALPFSPGLPLSDKKASLDYRKILRDNEANDAGAATGPEPRSTPVQVQPARVIGELAGTYIVMEQEGGLVLVDKHAAHERILYERIKETVAYGNRQVLLSPVILALDREEYGALLENIDKVAAMGFLIEDFGGGSVIVREIPLEMGEKDIAFLLGDIAAKLRAGLRDLTPGVLDRLYYSIACKGAVRAKDKNSLPELEAIVEKLARNPDVTHCPHGRPVRVAFTADEIGKMFER